MCVIAWGNFCENEAPLLQCYNSGPGGDAWLKCEPVGHVFGRRKAQQELPAFPGTMIDRSPLCWFRAGRVLLWKSAKAGRRVWWMVWLARHGHILVFNDDAAVRQNPCPSLLRRYFLSFLLPLLPPLHRMISFTVPSWCLLPVMVGVVVVQECQAMGFFSYRFGNVAPHVFFWRFPINNHSWIPLLK